MGLVGRTPPPNKIKIIFADDGGGSQAGAAFATYSPTIQGHPGAAGANAVGASYFRANPVCLPQDYPNYTVEAYSSAGGDPVLFDVTGAPQTAVVRQKPNFVAPDGGNTTFFAQILGARGDAILQCANAPGTWNFFGTSAAGPHAAGIAALLMQAQPNSTPDLITQALQNTALVNMAAIDPASGNPVPQTAVNFDTGYGFVQADAALAQVLPVVTLTPSSLNLGIVQQGGSSSTQVVAPVNTVTLSNVGGAPLTIGKISSGDPAFAETDNCPASLAPAANCTITVTFNPTAVQQYSSTLNLAATGNMLGATQVALSGTGVVNNSGGGAFGPWLLLPGFAAFLISSQKAAVLKFL